jgi:hypothetical protein
MFGMFQKKNIGFKQIQRKKRLDRAMQLAILGTMASGVFIVVKGLVGVLAKVTGKSQSLVSVSLATTVVLAAALKQLLAPKKVVET